MFSYWRMWGVFSEDFRAHIKGISLHRVSDCCLKSQTNATMIQPYTQHNFASIKLCPWSKHQRFVFDSSLLFGLNIVIKDPFFITFNNIFENQVISLLWKKTCRYGYTIFLILLTKSMRDLNAHLACFSYLFQVAIDCGLEILGGQVLILKCFCMDCIPPIL